MRKQILLFLAFVICATTLFAKETENKKDTYIFIDISGSASEIFSEIQDYAIDEILPSLNKETNLSIYKFYGKCVNIYDQKLKTDFDFEYAKERIQKLLPNGPWTNLDLVKSVIKEKNIDLAITNVFILTDGHQELENGENEYYLSQDNINEFLEDCDLINKGDWFLLVYKYKEKSTPVVIEEPVISIEPPVIQNKPVEKKTYNINFGIFKLIILILFFLCLFMYVISVISFFIWNILKNKSVKLKQFIDYYWSCFWRYVLCVCCVLANLLLYFFYSIMIPLVQIIFMILGIGLTIYASIISVKLLIRNSKYSIKIYKIYYRLTKNDYIDIATVYDLKSSDCNYVLFLKRKKISDINFSEDEIERKQIVLGLALKKINDCNAIGIQKGRKFYFLNLEKIFERLNIQLSVEERKQIAEVISNSYGNDKLDKIDWTLGTSIGLITGLMDIFLVGKPGDSKLQNFMDYNEEKIVKFAAKISGYKGDSTEGAVNYLENKFWVPYDKTTINEIGMDENNHHLLSLAHSNDIVGLLFAILDTRLSIKKTIENNGILYRVVSCTYNKSPETIEQIKKNKNIHFIFGDKLVRLIEPITFQRGTKKGNEKEIEDVSNKCLYKVLYEICKDNDEPKTTVMCIVFGFVLWLLHLYSDRIGAASTVKKEGRGTGIAAPFQELFANVDVSFADKLLNAGEEKLHKAANDIGKEMFEKGFDNRFFKTQKIPVLINEYITKILFIVKEIFYYKKELEIKDIRQILFSEGIIKTSSSAIKGNSNFELEKTLTLSFSVFSIVDISGAIIGNDDTIDKLLSINYAGLIKLGKESLSVFFSYLRRWTASPDKIIQEIEKLAETMVEEDKEETEIEEREHEVQEVALIDFVK